MMKMKHDLGNKTAGFTLLEILLVVAAIAILAGIVIVAINPAKQLADNRNARRHSDVAQILNAVYQYAIDNNGAIPSAISQATNCDNSNSDREICKTGGNCGNSTDLSVLTTNEKYLPSLPRDPQASNANGTGYFIIKSLNGRVTVCAPNAENAGHISITK